MIRAGKNGCSSDVIFYGRKIYHDWDSGIPITELGQKLDKKQWLKNTITDESKLDKVLNLFIDWNLYENGWYIPYKNGYKNEHLWYYLSQMCGYSGHRPKVLAYLISE